MIRFLTRERPVDPKFFVSVGRVSETGMIGCLRTECGIVIFRSRLAGLNDRKRKQDDCQRKRQRYGEVRSLNGFVGIRNADMLDRIRMVRHCMPAFRYGILLNRKQNVCVRRGVLRFRRVLRVGESEFVASFSCGGRVSFVDVPGKLRLSRFGQLYGNAFGGFELPGFAPNG